MDGLDRRLNPYRPDLASVTLIDEVEAETYVTPLRKMVARPVLDLYAAMPNPPGLASQLLRGEEFDVFGIQNGIAWGQSVTDRYVGYVDHSGLGVCELSEIVITAQLAHIYPEPSIKSTPLQSLPFLSKVRRKGATENFIELKDGFVCAAHTTPIGTDDPTSIAERFLNAPYLWGGKSQLGLDCSALVQLAHSALGMDCPRDSDMQLNGLGEFLPEGSDLQRGDLIFWAGHVGIMQDSKTLLHANAHHMKVVSEPLNEVEDRIKDVEEKDVLARKRIMTLRP